MTAALLGNLRNVIGNTFSKLLLLFLLTTFYLVLTTSSAFAQTTATPSAINYQRIPENLPSQSPHTMSMALNNFGHALACILIGQSPVSPCLEYKFMKDAQGVARSYPVLASVNTTGGLLGMGGSVLDLLYTEQPLDQASFFAYLGRNIGFVDKANAQVGGSGNQVLSPIFALWTVSRNFSYLLMILIFIGVGLMVMFRQKLNPQTVVSVQMALPGLVIGLILITFSYFLASFITDVAYVGTDLVGYYFDEAIKVNDPSAASNDPLTQRLELQNPLTAGGYATWILNEESIRGFLGQAIDSIPDKHHATPGAGNPVPGPLGIILDPQGVVRLFSGGLTYLLYNSFLSPIGDLLGSIPSVVNGVAKLDRLKGLKIPPGWTTLISNVLGGTGTTAAAGFAAAAYIDPTTWLSLWAFVVAIIIMLYTIVKLLFRLLNCYLTIIFLTIASPFVFLASSLPGRQGLAMNWIRNMLCNILAFPAVIAVFYFAAFLVGSSAQIPGFNVTTPFDPTQAQGNLPFLGGLNLDFLRRALAFMAILATPSIPDIICRSVGKPGQGGGIIGGAVAGAIAGGQRYQGQISGQTQKAGGDMGSWRGALFGTQPIQAGRGGDIGLALAQIRTGNPHLQTTATGVKQVGNITGMEMKLKDPTVPRWKKMLIRAEIGLELARRTQQMKSPISRGAAAAANAEKPYVA